VSSSWRQRGAEQKRLVYLAEHIIRPILSAYHHKFGYFIHKSFGIVIPSWKLIFIGVDVGLLLTIFFNNGLMDSLSDSFREGFWP